MRNYAIRKTISLGVIILFIGLCIVPTSGNKLGNKSVIPTDRGNTLYVGGSGPGNYTKIQDAIDDAVDGDTVFVYSGIYYENVEVDKSINLIGEDRETVIIDGNNIGNCVNLSADWINISGFTIQNADYYGIHIDSKNNIITDNDIINNRWCSIFSDRWYSYNNIIRGNNFTNNPIVIIFDSCYNIIVGNNFYNADINLGSIGNTISENSFFNAGLGISNLYQKIVSNNTVNDKPLIYLENKSDMVFESHAGQIILIYCDNITVRNQEILDTTWGITLFNSDNCFINSNTISSSRYFGLYISRSCNNNILGNNISNNDKGIGLYSSDKNMITENKIQSNSIGIDIANSSDNTIDNNDIKNNDRGIEICSFRNKIINNNFLKNKMNAFFLKMYNSVWEFINNYHKDKNIWDGNYWNKPRVLPKIIFGDLIIIFVDLPIFAFVIEFDRHPASEPYDI